MTVFLALPHRGDISVGAMMGAVQASKRQDVRLRHLSRSLLPHCFNLLWCGALNERPVDHWAMLHDDIAPQPGWLDVLIAEMETHNADIMSAVVPIRDERGLSSTAVRHPETGWLRRLTIHETNRLPETFDAAGAGYPGQQLLVNTGLWVCRFDRDWVERFCFREDDGIHRDAAGKFYATVMSEDWNLSMDAADLGLKVMATRKVKLRHVGPYGYPSWGDWGQWTEDREPSAPLTGNAGE